MAGYRRRRPSLRDGVLLREAVRAWPRSTAAAADALSAAVSGTGRLTARTRRQPHVGSHERGEPVEYEPRRLGRRGADLYARGLQRRLLRLRRAGGAGDDGARMAHGLAFGGGESGDVADDRFGHVIGDVGRGAFLRVAADLADEHDEFGVRVGLEGREASMCVVPTTGSPPMPTAEEKPVSRSSYMSW